MITVPRETTSEFVDLGLTDWGSPAASTLTVEYAVTAQGARPTNWSAAIYSAPRWGFLFNATAQGIGTWQVWARVNATVVLDDPGLILVS